MPLIDISDQKYVQEREDSTDVHLRINLKYFSDDIFLIIRVLQNDRENRDSKLVEHLKGGQEVGDRFNVLKHPKDENYQEMLIFIS